MSLIAMLVAAAAPAVLADPAEEARAQALEREIRCVQCENEPIAQSTADIAADMRRLVRERVAEITMRREPVNVSFQSAPGARGGAPGAGTSSGGTFGP